MPHKLLAALRGLLIRLGLLRPGKLQYIGGSDTLPPPLTREEEGEVLARLDAGEEEARQILIERNLRLVVYIARRFENTGINIEDLISIGTIGLIKSVNTYRTDKNIKLATYASRCIENEILMYLRKNASQRGEVSLDEPLNTDWDGNELLLSDVLGTDADTVMRPGTDPEGGRRPPGHFPVLYLPSGKTDHQPPEARNPENELRKSGSPFWGTGFSLRLCFYP